MASTGSDLLDACSEGKLDVVKRILQNKPSLLNYRGASIGTPRSEAFWYVLSALAHTSIAIEV